MLCPRWLFSTRVATTARALCVFPIDLILTISHLFQRAFCWLLQYNKPMSKASLVNGGSRIPNPKLPPRLLPVALLSEDRRWQKHRFPPRVAISLQRDTVFMMQGALLTVYGVCRDIPTFGEFPLFGGAF